MSILSFFLYLAGVISFSFILWKKLREDYPYESIFSATIILLGAGLLASSFKETGVFSFWIGTLILPPIVFYTIKKLGFKFFEFADAGVPAFFLLAFFAGLVPAFKNPTNPVVVLGTTMPLFSLLAYNFFFARYRRFSWYPSGKVGFAGFVSLGVYFLLRAGVAIYPATLLLFKGGIPLVSGFEILANLFVFTLLIFVIYMRSGRAGAEMLSRLRKK